MKLTKTDMANIQSYDASLKESIRYKVILIYALLIGSLILSVKMYLDSGYEINTPHFIKPDGSSRAIKGIYNQLPSLRHMAGFGASAAETLLSLDFSKMNEQLQSRKKMYVPEQYKEYLKSITGAYDIQDVYLSKSDSYAANILNASAVITAIRSDDPVVFQPYLKNNHYHVNVTIPMWQTIEDVSGLDKTKHLMAYIELRIVPRTESLSGLLVWRLEVE